MIFEAGRPLTALGWGKEWANASGSSPLSPVLREVNVPFVSDEECGKAYDEPSLPFDICAGASDMGACYGDSGKWVGE